NQENIDATMAALQGVQLGARPDLWQTYDAGRAQVLEAARPVTALKTRFAQQAAEIDGVLAKAGRDAAAAAYLPMVGRDAQAWTVLLDGATADVLGFLPLDSF